MEEKLIQLFFIRYKNKDLINNEKWWFELRKKKTLFNKTTYILGVLGLRLHLTV